MDLKRLTHFIALAEEGRFAAAAERVHLSTAAFSRSIQNLEDSVGMRLFDRTAQGTALTRAGQVLQRRARELLFDSRCLAHEIDLLRTGEHGELALGAAPIAAAVVLPEMLVQLRRSSPKLLIKVRFGNVGQLIDRLDLEEIDFFLGDARLIGEADRYETVPVAALPTSVYCRPGHRLAAAGVARPASLVRHGVATVALNARLRAHVAGAVGFTTPAEFPQMVECDDVGLLVRLINESDMLGMLPHAVFRGTAVELKPLHYAGGVLPIADLHAIWLKGRTLSPAASRAIALAKALWGAQSEGVADLAQSSRA